MDRIHGIQVIFTGYGHWRVITNHYNKIIDAVTTNSRAVDDYNSDEEKRKNRGYKALRQEVIRKNKR